MLQKRKKATPVTFGKLTLKMGPCGMVCGVIKMLATMKPQMQHRRHLSWDRITFEAEMVLSTEATLQLILYSLKCDPDLVIPRMSVQCTTNCTYNLHCLNLVKQTLQVTVELE